MKYINTIRDRQAAEFARVEPSFDGAVVEFNINNAQPMINGQRVNMVKGFARLSVPTAVESCDSTCVGYVTEVVEIRFNEIRGGANHTGLLAEVSRVLADAVSNYQLLNGVVPPVSATFNNE